MRGEFEDLWPLQLVDLRDDDMFGTLYRLLRTLPQVRIWNRGYGHLSQMMAGGNRGLLDVLGYLPLQRIELGGRTTRRNKKYS